MLAALLLTGGLLFYHKGEGKNIIHEQGEIGPAAPTAPLKTMNLSVVGGKAEAYVDGKDMGATPLIFDRPVGDHFTVTFKREGYQDLVVTYDVTEEHNEWTYAMDRIKP